MSVQEHDAGNGSTPPGHSKSTIDTIKDIAQIVALVLGGAWTVYWSYQTFVKPESLRPDDYQPHITLTATIEAVEQLSTQTIVSLDINIVNNSRRFLRNVGSIYTARGFQSDEKGTRDLPELLDQLVTTARDMNRNPQDLLSWHLARRSGGRTISVGRILPDNWWFAPAEEYGFQTLISVPCEIHILRVTMDAIYYVFHHGDEEVFRVDWQARADTIWYEIKVRDASGHFVAYDYGDAAHEEMRKKHGLQWSVAAREILIQSTSDTLLSQPIYCRQDIAN